MHTAEQLLPCTPHHTSETVLVKNCLRFLSFFSDQYYTVSRQLKHETGLKERRRVPDVVELVIWNLEFSL